MTRVEHGPGWELHLGDYRTELVNVIGDALIVDAPFSARTHAGHDEGADVANRKTRARKSSARAPREGRRKLGYAAWTDEDVAACVDFFEPRIRGWMTSITDHVLEPAWKARMRHHGRYTFDYPIPWVAPGSRVRMRADGPACWTCPIVVSRPSSAAYAAWRALPGAYVVTSDRGVHGDEDVTGSKPLALMRALVRDYSRPGDVVVDPCAGGGTTLLAAVIEGRYAIGAERDPATFELALARLRRGYTPCLFEAGAMIQIELGEVAE